MRNLFVLAYDDRGDPEVVCDYQMGNFDLTAFWSGERFDGTIPSDVRLWVGPGEPRDYLANPISWEIVSAHCWKIIEPLVKEECQVLSPPLYRASDKAQVCDYVLLNVTRSIAAAKKEFDGRIFVSDLHLFGKHIPANVHLFRLAESPTVLVASDLFVKTIRDHELTGIAFLPTTIE